MPDPSQSERDAPASPVGTPWAEGLASAIDALKPLVSESYTMTSEALRRVWKARDEVERLQRLLANAEVALTAAEREHGERREEMQMIWGHFRAEVEQIPVRTTSGDAGAHDASR